MVVRGRRRTTVSPVLGLLAHLPRRCAHLPRAARRLVDPAPAVRDRHRARRDHQRDLVDPDPAVRPRGSPLARGNGCEQGLERRHLHLHLRRGPRRGREHDHARHRAAARRRRRGLRPRRPRHRGDPPGGRAVGGQLSRATRPGVDEEIGEPALRVRAVVGPDRPRPRRRLRGPVRLPPTDAAVLRRRRPRDPPDTAVLPHVQGQLGGAGRSRSAGAVLPDRPARPRPTRRRDLRRDERLVPPLGARRAGRHGAPRALRGHLHGHEGRRRRLPRRLPAAAPRGGLDAEQHGRARLTAVPLGARQPRPRGHAAVQTHAPPSDATARPVGRLDLLRHERAQPARGAVRADRFAGAGARGDHARPVRHGVAGAVHRVLPPASMAASLRRSGLENASA